jgi:excisionase family DNA binding protein
MSEHSAAPHRRLLTVPEVADVLRVSPQAVRRYIRNRELRALKIPRGWRIDPRDLEDYLEAQKCWESNNEVVA